MVQGSFSKAGGQFLSESCPSEESDFSQEQACLSIPAVLRLRPLCMGMVSEAVPGDLGWCPDTSVSGTCLWQPQVALFTLQGFFLTICILYFKKKEKRKGVISISEIQR